MDEEIKSLREKGSLDQSIALNRITMKLLEDRAHDCKRLWIALIISIMVNVIIVGCFLWRESQWNYTEDITTTTTVEQDAGEGESNNIFQSGEQATYNEGGE